MARKSQRPEAFERCLNWFLSDRAAHDVFIGKVEQRYKAYRAVIDIRSDAAAWTSKQHPPFVLDTIETMVSNLLDPDPRWKIRARPRLVERGQWDQISQGAKSLEVLLAEQAESDRLAEKQVPFAKQSLIAGLSVYKTAWDYQKAVRTRQQMISKPLHDQYDNLIGHLPTLARIESREPIRDDPTAEVVDVRDFIWHEAAVSLDKAQRVHHRVWYSIDELKRLQAAGIYQNVEALGETRDFGAEYSTREQELFQANRTKDMVEVVETWWRREDGGLQVTSFANRTVLLRDVANPFDHGQYPFIVCSSMPDLFRVPGVSTVELIADIQEMLWTLANQRIDNVRLLNNAIVLIASDVYDTDQFEWYPGAQWITDRPDQVKTLEVSDLPARISLEAEAMLKGDLQSVTGNMPFLSGANSQTIDQKTATGVSIITNLAQRRLAAHKQQFKWAYKRLGEQWIMLNQQFITEKRAVEVIGAGGASSLWAVLPEQIGQADYYIDIEQMDESMMRQERRAEAQAKLQVALNAIPIVAQLAQMGSATMINIDEYIRDFLEAYGISDTARYFTEATPPPPTAPQQAATQHGSVNGAALTAPQATDMNSPSNTTSQSPVAALQRMAAMAGGAVNG